MNHSNQSKVAITATTRTTPARSPPPYRLTLLCKGLIIGGAPDPIPAATGRSGGWQDHRRLIDGSFGNCAPVCPGVTCPSATGPYPTCYDRFPALAGEAPVLIRLRRLVVNSPLRGRCSARTRSCYDDRGTRHPATEAMSRHPGVQDDRGGPGRQRATLRAPRSTGMDAYHKGSRSWGTPP